MSTEDAKDFWPAMVEPDLVQEIRRFAADLIAPRAHELDAEDLYAKDIVKQLAERGFNTVSLPQEYGGGGKSYGAATAVCEEVGYASAGVAISLITIFQAQTIIRLYGSDSLRTTWLPQFARGLLSSYALTEAAHGSDIRSLETKAAFDGTHWVLNGEKSFITSGSAAEFFIILAETASGVSVFAVPGGTPGLSSYVGENSATFGLRNGPHVNIVLRDVRLPADHLVGVEGKGVRQAVGTLNYSRTLAAAVSIGIARAAFDHAVAFAANRRAFGQTVIEFQGIQWYLAEMLSRIDAARLLVYAAARALDTGVEVLRLASAAKLIASEVATEVAAKAVQICGAYGTTVNAPFGRFLRDAKTYEIGGGSSEVLKNSLTRRILQHPAAQR
jgi:alkylation response protein AidB-like acyl-CoA dehydrogenase